MVSEQLQKKIDGAIRLLQSVGKRYASEIEVAYSGGKDSDVILQLAKESGIRYRAIYKNTTIDPPGTIKHVKDMGAEMLRPKTNFFKLMEKNGFPSRFRRFCCKELKEYKVLDKCIVGIRRSESVKRAKRYTEPTQCRWYGAKKEENHVEQIMPILDWTDDDVLEFILDRGITLAPIYYASGEIDVTRRLGCMCCPLASRRLRLKEFKKHPNMVKAYLRAGQKYMDAHPTTKFTQKFKKNSANAFVRMLYFDRDIEYYNFVNNMFGTTDCVELLEKEFDLDLTTI